MAPRSRSLILSAGLVGLALVVGAATFAVLPAPPPRGLAGTSVGAADIGGPFTLTTASGGKLSDTDLKGKPFAVFFGFTHCPEVCPTTLAETSQTLQALGPEGKDLKVLFITVDPERDTPRFMANYLQSFDPRIVGLTGTRAEIDAVGKEYRAYWKKVPTDDGDYTMDHTASMFLMDSAGRFVGTVSYDEAAPMRLQKFKRLVEGAGSAALAVESLS